MVEGPKDRVVARDLPGAQGRLVLASLAASDDPIARPILADRIWGDRPPGAWDRHLSVVVSKLRRILARVEAETVISTSAGAYSLRLADGSEVDIRSARRDAGRAERALAGGSPERALSLAEAARTIARREFLPGDDGTWVDAMRFELQQLLVRALEVVADAQRELGNLREALTSAEEVSDLEPFRETSYRRLMRLHLESGNRAEALLVYERCRKLLADELGVDPAPETHELYGSVLAGAAVGANRQAAPSIPVEPPPTHYARSGDVALAYQTVGNGVPDVVVVQGWILPMEEGWTYHAPLRYIHRISKRARIVTFDRRGTGLSDRVKAVPPASARTEDLRAVLDDAGCERPVLLAHSEGGPTAIRFAITYPERVSGLILYGCFARMTPSEGYPWGYTETDVSRLRRYVERAWGSGSSIRAISPSAASEPEFARWAARAERRGASPGSAADVLDMNLAEDVRADLESVRTPTLVLHHRDDPTIEVGHGRFLAEHIAGARYVELPGSEHWPLGRSATHLLDAALDEIERFVHSVDR